MNIFKRVSEKKMNDKCEHKNIKWLDIVCMIAGYKKEGICLDCYKTLLKDNDGKVVEK